MIVKNNLLNFKKAFIYQDTEYFKMSMDSMLLANFVTVNLRDKNILDIATGNAPIPMLLTYRTKARIYGVEIQEPVYNLGKVSIYENKMTDQIVLINDDAKNLVDRFESDIFDVITCNPPYFNTKNKKFENDNEVKSLARHEKTLNLEDIFIIARKLLKNNGRLAMVHRTERFIEIIDKSKKYNFEPKRVRFVYPNYKKNSDLVLIEFSLNGKSGMKLEQPLYIYDCNGKYTYEVSNMFGE